MKMHVMPSQSANPSKELHWKPSHDFNAFTISYWDLIKFPYFTDTPGRGG
jgi:hypothetical protein